MNKTFLYKLFYIVSIVLAAVFCVLVAIDSYKYSTSLNSAPFYVFVLARAITFLLPALISFIIGRVIYKKVKK